MHIRIKDTTIISGELDNSLMPVGKEMFQHEEDDIEWEEEEDILGEARPGTTKRKQYYAKKVNKVNL